MNAVRPLARTVVALLAAAMVLAGCSFDPYKLPLPGGLRVYSPRE